MYDLDPELVRDFKHQERLLGAIRKQLQDRPREQLVQYLSDHLTDTSATGQVMRQLVIQAMNAQAAAARVGGGKK